MERSKPLWTQNVIVLAKNLALSKAQLDVLNKGLTFVPTINLKKDQKVQLQLDIQNYHRKVKLATYFRGKNTSTTVLPFMPSSDWVPPPEKLPPEVHFLIKKDKKDFEKYFRQEDERNNLSEGEQIALKELADNRQIVIKPADKGSATVIMGRDQYIQEVGRQLRDTTYYVKLTEPIYLHTVPIVHQIIDQLYKDKKINAKQRRYLKGDCEPRPRRFYVLPKIHKDPEKWTVPFEIPPGRPIVSDCSSETYQTAEFIEYYLNPLSTKHPAYIKDTYHFISLIRDLKIPPNSYFFTIDVDSLYTNIDITAGLNTVKNIFLKYSDPTRPDAELLQLLEINLTRNDFEFNGEFYLQIKGTAMGKRFAPSYANIFMAHWEENALKKCPKKPLYYFRYLDDIFGLWTFSKEDFQDFITILDTHDPSIRLKHVLNQERIDFLDTTIYKGPSFSANQTLDIKVFFKETDTHSLLFKTSFHPKHTYRGLVKSQLIRFKRICTKHDDFKDAVNILFSSLRKRGYCRSFLRQCLSTFENTQQKTKSEPIPLITTFSTTSLRINSKLKTNYTTLIKEQGLLPNHQLISAYRRNQNLKDYLVRAELKPVQKITKDNMLTGVFVQLKYVQNKVNKTILKISQVFNPATRNCVYLIFCSKCGKQYVGETKNSLLTRMTQHRYVLRSQKDPVTPLVAHFLIHGSQSVRVSGLQSNSSWTMNDRKQMERKWIHLLDTKEPQGLNKRWR